MSFTRISGTGSVPAAVQTDANGNWTQTGFQQGTTYRVTPVKTGCTFNPTSRDFSSASTGLNFIGTCTPTPTPTRVVRVGGARGVPGNTVCVPIVLVSQGNENALSFSLTFDTNVFNVLNNNPQAAVDVDAAGATLNVNSSQTAQGRLGVTLTKPAGQRFDAGTRRIIAVTFTIASNTSALSTQIGFGDQPVAREVSDFSANSLPANYEPGAVTMTNVVYEADVAPRDTGGDGRLSIIDWVQVGRFAAGLDTVSLCEFQRADCAPRATSGNGSVTITDWVQAGRYAAALDPPQPAGGPTAPGSIAQTTALRRAQAEATASDPRTVRVINANIERGRRGTVIIELDAQGTESALSFSFNFDPSQLRFVSAAVGSGATSATLNVNSIQAANGRIGLVLASPAGQVIAAGLRPIVNVTFDAPISGSAASTTISFGDQPIPREISDANDNRLSADYIPGAVTFTGNAPTNPFILTVSPNTVPAGAQLTVAWNVPSGRSAADWVGLYQTGTPDTAYLWWQYTQGATSGSFMLTAPRQAGQYEFRYFLADSFDRAGQSNVVTVEAIYSLTASPSTVAPNGSLTICWRAPGGRPSKDWIGLYRTGDPNTGFLWWQYIEGTASGCFTLNAPAGTGRYEFRYLLDDGYEGVAQSNAVTVSNTPTAQAANKSVRTACAEEDNVNVGFSGQVASYVIEATHPAYSVAPDNCAPDFSNCSPAPPGFPFNPGVLKLFDDGETVVEAVREASWWRSNGMTAAVDDRPSVTDVHYIRIYRRIAGTSEYPQVLVLYMDGNLRLIPQPPVGANSVCFGSSVIIGPAAPASRPIAEIASVTYLSGSRRLEIKYKDGGSATIILREVNRTLTRVQVVVNYSTGAFPFATFRSMFVADGNADVDHVKWVDASGVMHDDPIMTFPGGEGTEWFFYRQTRSRHNSSAPDIRIRLE